MVTLHAKRGGADMQRILVVDDDPLVSLSIKLSLERQGFEAVLADGGATGLAALEGNSFDAMIVDIFMPNMRGFESIRVFHRRAPDVPLIAISGYAFAQPAVGECLTDCSAIRQRNDGGPDVVRVA